MTLPKAVTTEERQANMGEAMELRSRLFDLANSFAGAETGDVAVMLHQACNCILFAKQELERK